MSYQSDITNIDAKHDKLVHEMDILDTITNSSSFKQLLSPKR